MTLENNRAPLLYYTKLCASIISKPSVKPNLDLQSDTLKSGQNWWFFVLCDLEIRWMTLKNNRTPLLCYFNLCASFRSHWWIKTGATVRKRPIWVKINNFFSRLTLQFDLWPWKTIGHLYYDNSSFMHHFVAIGEFKLELQPRNTQFGSKLAIFLSRVTFKFDRWPRKSIGHIFYATLSFVHHLIAIGEFKLGLHSRNSQFGSNLGCFVPCDLGIWQMTLKNSYATSNFVHHYIIISEFKMELRSGNGEIGFWPLWLWHLTSDLDLLHGHHCDRDLWSLTLTFCMGITIVNGNNSWKFHNDTIMGTLWKRCDGQTDGQGDWTIHRAAWLQLKNNNIPVPESNISHQSFKSLL